MLTRALELLLLLSCLGCATSLRVEPPLPSPEQVMGAIAGRLDYHGPAEYVPRTLVHREDAALVLRYVLDVRTDRDDLAAWVVLFNPLTLFGFPTGASLASADARLEVVRQGQVVGRYEARATVRKVNHLYNADSLTAIRKGAVLAVRDSLDAQLARDVERLGTSSILDPSTPSLVPNQPDERGM